MPRRAKLDDELCARSAWEAGSFMLRESAPTRRAAVARGLRAELQERGFLRPLLAHPERSPAVPEDVERLSQLSTGGMLCT